MKDDKLVGLNQYILKKEEIVKIRSIFILERKFKKKIGKKLLFLLIDDVITKNSISSEIIFNALVKYTIDIPGSYK